jgi:hypothetical protein
MPLPILEQPIYGQMTLETTAWVDPYVWIDRTPNLVESIDYALGGRPSLPGQPTVEVGTLSATFKNLDTQPLVGDMVRLRRTGTSEYAFVGLVQDVSQRIVFDDSISYTTPINLTTINCIDWVGYISQFQLIGIGGVDEALDKMDVYAWPDRIRAINETLGFLVIGAPTFTEPLIISDTDKVGTLAEHLDLLCDSAGLYWFGRNVIPYSTTLFLAGVCKVLQNNQSEPSGKTFTNLAGTTGQLHYTEIDFSQSSQAIANNIVIENDSLITNLLEDYPEISKIGGSNDSNYAIVDGQEIPAVRYAPTWKGSDSASIAIYGNRTATVTTNLAPLVEATNLISNPSAEYDDVGYSGGTNTIARRRRTKEAATPFTAYDGEWAVRVRQRTAAASGGFSFSGAESDGTPIFEGTTYYAKARVARGTPSAADLRAQIVIRWMNDDENVISSTTGANVTLVTREQWYEVTASGTAPAGAVRATFSVSASRVGGSNIAAGQFFWVDALSFSKQNTTYFDGDTSGNTSNLYVWTGDVGLSPSLKLTNNLEQTISDYLDEFSNAYNLAKMIRWNAQEDLASVSALQVGRRVDIRFGSDIRARRIIGIEASISADRYMINYYLGSL